MFYTTISKHPAAKGWLTEEEILGLRSKLQDLQSMLASLTCQLGKVIEDLHP